VSIILVLIPLGLVLLGLAIWAFVWAVDNDQFEDLDRAGTSILFDEDELEQGERAEPATPVDERRES
jgi:cbb3-type cytochrome oxidase maturation protein